MYYGHKSINEYSEIESAYLRFSIGDTVVSKKSNIIRHGFILRISVSSGWNDVSQKNSSLSLEVAVINNNNEIEVIDILHNVLIPSRTILIERCQ